MSDPILALAAGNVRRTDVRISEFRKVIDSLRTAREEFWTQYLQTPLADRNGLLRALDLLRQLDESIEDLREHVQRIQADRERIIPIQNE